MSTTFWIFAAMTTSILLLFWISLGGKKKKLLQEMPIATICSRKKKKNAKTKISGIKNSKYLETFMSYVTKKQCRYSSILFSFVWHLWKKFNLIV